MKLNFNRNQCFSMPAKLYQLLNTELEKVAPPAEEVTAITFNFRDPDYSADEGGYHAVEMRLEKRVECLQLVYISDFSYQGHPYPELVKEIDVCFESQQVYSLFGGWVPPRQCQGFVRGFVHGFIDYYEIDCYQVQISFN